MQRTRLSLAAIALLLTVVLISSAEWTGAAAAAATPSSLSTKQRQHQRLQAFGRYAQRVGAALEALTNGPPSDAWDAPEDGADGQAEGGNAQPPLSTTGFGALASLAQAMQYPHTAVQAAAQLLTERAGAARTLAAVVVGAALTEREEAQLAAVQAAAAAEGLRVGEEAATVEPASRQRTAAPPPQAAVATPSRQVDTLDEETFTTDRFIRCRNGYVAVASNTLLSCSASGLVTIDQYGTVPAADQPTCSLSVTSYDAVEQQCQCAADQYIRRIGVRSYRCVVRPAELQITFDDTYLCRNPADTALGLPGTTESEYCITTTRNAALNLSAQWRYRYLSTDAVKAAINDTNVYITPDDAPTSAPGLQWVVMGRTPPTGYITAATSTPYAVGTYTQLRIHPQLFGFLTTPTAATEAAAAAAGTEAFYVSWGSFLFETKVFSAVYSFAAPRKTMEHYTETMLHAGVNLTLYVGDPSGMTSHFFALDLANVSDDFIEGDQMYAEYGVRGGSVAHNYRVARLHIAFTDRAVPADNTHRYRKQFNPLYILLIVTIGVIIIGSALAVVWYHVMAKEEYDDSSVADAQRKKAQRLAAAN